MKYSFILPLINNNYLKSNKDNNESANYSPNIISHKKTEKGNKRRKLNIQYSPILCKVFQKKFNNFVLFDTVLTY